MDYKLARLITFHAGAWARCDITHLEASDDDDGTPMIVLDAVIDAILFLRSGNVSMTKSRNSNNAPTSFCSSCKLDETGKRRKKKEKSCISHKAYP